MTWNVEVTDDFLDWWVTLTEDQQEAWTARIDRLEQDGPHLRRPLVGEIKGSRYDPQMKELICNEGNVAGRVLFIFDPRQTAILLLGGNKKGRWHEWYDEAVPDADAIYEEYLAELRREGLL